MAVQLDNIVYDQTDTLRIKLTGPTAELRPIASKLQRPYETHLNDLFTSSDLVITRPNIRSYYTPLIKDPDGCVTAVIEDFLLSMRGPTANHLAQVPLPFQLPLKVEVNVKEERELAKAGLYNKHGLEVAILPHPSTKLSADMQTELIAAVMSSFIETLHNAFSDFEWKESGKFPNPSLRYQQLGTLDNKSITPARVPKLASTIETTVAKELGLHSTQLGFVSP